MSVVYLTNSSSLRVQKKRRKSTFGSREKTATTFRNASMVRKKERKNIRKKERKIDKEKKFEHFALLDLLYVFSNMGLKLVSVHIPTANQYPLV